jgi:hypothetical protein
MLTIDSSIFRCCAMILYLLRLSTPKGRCGALIAAGTSSALYPAVQPVKKKHFLKT